MNWLALTLLILPILFGGILVHGLATGRMPTGKSAPVAKADDASLFWMMGALWAMAGFISLAWATVKLAGS
jgi:hypothetical protein